VVETVLPVPQIAREGWLFAYVLSDGGYMQVRHLELRRADESTLSVIARYLAFIGWALLAVSACVGVLRRSERTGLQLIAVALGALIAAGALTPQPHFAAWVQWSEAATAPLVKGVVDGLSAPARWWRARDTQPRAVAEVGDPSSPPVARTDTEAASSADGGQTPAAKMASKPSSSDPGASAPARRASQAGPDARGELPMSEALLQRNAWTLRDGTGHLLAFMALALVSTLAWSTVGAHRVMLGAFAVSISIQALQGMLITRDADLADFAFDSLGIAIGTALAAMGLALARKLRGGRAQA
jgi:hypothetical protein